MLCVVMISFIKINYENTQRFSISRSIGPGKTLFLSEFFSCRAGVKPFGRAGYVAEFPLFILRIVPPEGFNGKGSAGMAHAK